MDILVFEVIGGVIVAAAAAGITYRMWQAKRFTSSYQEGRKLRLHADYDGAEAALLSSPKLGMHAQLLRFWMDIERLRVADARAVLAQIQANPDSAKYVIFALATHECAMWLALRHDSISKAEQEAAQLLNWMNTAKSLPAYLHSSALYSHGCLLIENSSDKYAAERFSNSLQISRNAYGFDSIYAVPPAVAMAYLHFCAGSFEKSAKLLANGLSVYSRALGDFHPRTARLRVMLAIVASVCGFEERAAKEIRAGLDVFQKFGMLDSEAARTAQRALELTEKRQTLPRAF
jgi:hypothetical protein